MTRRRQSTGPSDPGLLNVPQEQFYAELDDRIEKGKDLRSREIESPAQLGEAKNDYYSWDEYNTDLLRRRFSTSEIADDYAWFAGVGGGPRNFEEGVGELHRDLHRKLRKLDSIHARIPLFVETAEVRAMPAPESAGDAPIEAIFIVHGHDDALKLGVESFLRRATEIEPLILHAQPNRGRTLIEKLEATGARAGYAVVLLTADDMGAEKTKADTLEPRARQNVVFEFGFFVGALGRAHVAVIYEHGVELPSDLHGLVYIEYDHGGAWRSALLRELREVGVSVDTNALLG